MKTDRGVLYVKVGKVYQSNTKNNKHKKLENFCAVKQKLMKKIEKGTKKVITKNSQQKKKSRFRNTLSSS